MHPGIAIIIYVHTKVMHLCKHRYNIYTDIKIEAYNIGLYQSTDIHFHVCHNILLPIRIHSLRDQKLYRETDIYIDMYICARTCICRNEYMYLYSSYTCKQSLWCLHTIPPKLQRWIYTLDSLSKIHKDICIHTYLHRMKDMSM